MTVKQANNIDYENVLVGKIIKAPRGGEEDMSNCMFHVLSFIRKEEDKDFRDSWYYFDVYNMTENKRQVIDFNEFQIGWFFGIKKEHNDSNNEFKILS